KAETAELLTQIEHAATAISAALAQGSTARSVDTIRPWLLELIERVPVSRLLASDAAATRRSVESATQLAEFRPCLTSIAELVNRLREELQTEMDRLSDYLRSTARRLQEFEQ